jgi:hypothetical protein
MDAETTGRGKMAEGIKRADVVANQSQGNGRMDRLSIPSSRLDLHENISHPEDESSAFMRNIGRNSLPDMV